jgi:hypothetical protein
LYMYNPNVSFVKFSLPCYVVCKIAEERKTKFNY